MCCARARQSFVDSVTVVASQLRLEGNRCAQAGDFAAARDKYRAALDVAPERLHHAIHSNLSLVALNAGDSAEALREAETAMALAPPEWTTVRRMHSGY